MFLGFIYSLEKETMNSNVCCKGHDNSNNHDVKNPHFATM